MESGTGTSVRVHTVGHGARPVEVFVGMLVEAGVGHLVDVRRFPGSRRHPQFGRDALATAVGDAGLRYTWQGESLGGRRQNRPGSRHTALRNASFVAYADHMDTPTFRTAVEELLAGAASEPPAVLCAETLWWHCHRMLVADALVVRGAVVEHLLKPGDRQPHRLTAGVRTGPDGWPVYDVGVDARVDAQDALPGL